MGKLPAFDVTRPSHSTWSPARTLWLALISVCCMMGQLNHALHFALVAHHWCASHGQLAHGAGHEHADDHAGPDAERHTSATGTTATPSRNSAEHEHDHCVAPATASCSEFQAAVSSITLSFPEPAVVDAELDQLPPIGLLRLAPKTSPPC